MATPIPPFNWGNINFAPASSVQPFTYKDGLTYLKRLELLAKYIDRVLVPYINENYEALEQAFILAVNKLITEVNAALAAQTEEVDQKILDLETYVNEQVAAIIGSSIELQDDVLAGILADLDSDSREYLDTVYAPISVMDTINTGRLSQENVNDQIALKANTEYVDDENGAQNVVIATKASQDDVDLKKPILAATVNTANVNFDTYTTSAVTMFTANQADASSPINGPGILVVESNTAFVKQTYTSKNQNGTVDMYVRHYSGATWSEWFNVTGDRGLKPKGKVSFIGDSYMAGTGATVAANRWTSKYCAAAGLTEENLANGGSGYVNNGAAGNFVAQSNGVSPDSTLAIICGGINDAPLLPTQATITAAVAAIVANIKTRAPRARIVFISPMWFHTSPSVDLMTMDGLIGTAVRLAGARYIENAMWLRVDRVELSPGDGHPNDAGYALIANWVYDNIIEEATTGPSHALFYRDLNNEMAINAGQTVKITDGTLRNAKRGWYNIRATCGVYGTGIGSIVCYAGTANRVTRADSSTDVKVAVHEMQWYHPGGDLYIGVGWQTTTGSINITEQTGNNIRVTCEWFSYN